MATEYTPNYNLDLYVSKDKPNLRDQYNSAMRKIDAQLKTNAGNTVIATTAVNNLTGEVRALDDKVSGYDGKIDGLTARVNGLNNNVNALDNSVDALENTVANNTAPKHHAVGDGDIYGKGTLLEYGHVKLSDTPGTLSGVNGVAASPKLVDAAIKAAMSGSTPTPTPGEYAPINHASEDKTYGAGTERLYGHVKVQGAFPAPESAFREGTVPSMTYTRSAIGEVDNNLDVLRQRVNTLADQIPDTATWKLLHNVENVQISSQQGDGTVAYDLRIWVNDAIHLAIVQYHGESINIPAGAAAQRFVLQHVDQGYFPKGSFGMDPVFFLYYDNGVGHGQALSLFANSDGTITLVSTQSDIQYKEGGNVRGQLVYYF